MTTLALVLTVIFLLGGLRLRGRLAKLAVLPPGGELEPPHPDHIFLTAPGVELDEATRRSASRWARAAGVEVLDLIPGDFPPLELLGLAELMDPATYRAAPLRQPRSAGRALLVSGETLARFGSRARPLIEATHSTTGGTTATSDTTATSGADTFNPTQATNSFLRAALDLQTFAPGAATLALAPSFLDRPAAGTRGLAATVRRRSLEAYFGDFALLVLLLQGTIWTLLLACLFTSPLPGLLAIFAFQFQATLGLGVLPESVPLRGQLPLLTAARFPLEVIQWLRTALARRPDLAQRAARIDELRPPFEAVMAAGVEQLLEERRDTCPLCAAPDLAPHRRDKDYFQHKPGTFHLERCRACGLVFQNPRLTPSGLNFYYADFYDGLGEETLDFIFSANPGGYAARARLAENHVAALGHGVSGETGVVAETGDREGPQPEANGHAQPAPRYGPRRWLDVGGGHGHFCLMARSVWPDTRFEVLDLADSVEKAVARGWADAGWRGFLPQLAADKDSDLYRHPPDLAPRPERAGGPFEVVSMSHYLEHTREPSEEIDAARQLLTDCGLLFIEVPDPQSPLGRWFGWSWLPWFQPQHQNLLPCTTLQNLLIRRGFEVLEVERGPAHQATDLHYSILVSLSRLLPPVDRPWLPATRPWHRLRHALVWTGVLPFLLCAVAADRLLAGFVQSRGWSNTYRVLARRVEGENPPALSTDAQASDTLAGSPPASPPESDLTITALYTNGAWTRQGFPGAALLSSDEADMVFGATNGFLRLATIGRSLPSLAASVIQRHAMLDYLLEEELADARNPQVLELAAGLSPRGIAFALDERHAGLDYIEADLPPVIARKRELLARSKAGQDAALAPNLHLLPVDAERCDLATLIEPARPLTIIAEGLCMYLDPAARRHFWCRVAHTLANSAAPRAAFLFDLVPPAEEPRPGLAGNLLTGLMKAATGGRSFARTGESRADLLQELTACGFSSVELFEPAEVKHDWNLPGALEQTQMVVYRCRP